MTQGWLCNEAKEGTKKREWQEGVKFHRDGEYVSAGINTCTSIMPWGMTLSCHEYVTKDVFLFGFFLLFGLGLSMRGMPSTPDVTLLQYLVTRALPSLLISVSLGGHGRKREI